MKRPESRQAEAFRQAFREQQCEWLTWMGGPMLYDGALFVERDHLTPEQHEKVRKAYANATRYTPGGTQ